jgi:FAD/FMN-containing dehydrogenase
MAEWRNWSGKQRASPQEIARPTSEEAVAALVRRASGAGTRVRCVGAAHSHSPLAVTEGTLLDLESFSGVVGVDPERRVASVGAGTRIFQLGPALLAAGLGLRNQGDIDRQAIAGAVATGTHGTGRTLRNLSASVAGARVILADGSAVDCDAETEPDLFEVARLSLGAVGVVTRLDLEVREAYRLRERLWLEDVDGVLDRIDALTAATRHFEFFWFPGQERAICKAIAETTDAAEYPLAAEGSRVAWSFEVLPSQRPDLHTEMEYSVPERLGPACFRAVRELLKTRFPEVTWPLEYRTVAADDLWLSMACGRPTVTVSVHQAIDMDDEPYFRACEEIFLAHQGRPHWGKLHYLDGPALASRYECWSDWWRARDAYDPDGTFLNDSLETLRAC